VLLGSLDCECAVVPRKNRGGGFAHIDAERWASVAHHCVNVGVLGRAGDGDVGKAGLRSSENVLVSILTRTRFRSNLGTVAGDA